MMMNTERRLGLSLTRKEATMCGIGCIVVAMVSCYGLSSALGFWYGPVHSIMPFLLLGIGVDDMFVIVQCLENLSADERTRPLPERVALALKHAGVSITVTTLTDFVAFGIGATTILPAMRSFCVYAAIGLLTLFALQCTLFVACMTLDQRRAEAHRDACLCCIAYKDYKPSECSKANRLQELSRKIYIPIIKNKYVRVVIIAISIGLASVNVWSCWHLKQDFDPMQYIPPNSYAYKYLTTTRDYFPEHGNQFGLYLGEGDYFAKQSTINTTYHRLIGESFVVPHSVEDWYQEFRKWLPASDGACLQKSDLAHQSKWAGGAVPPFLGVFASPVHNWVLNSVKSDPLPQHVIAAVLEDEEQFYDCVYMFITKVEPRFKASVKFTANKTHPRISATKVAMKLNVPDESDISEKVHAMETLQAIADSTGFREAIAYGAAYLHWQGANVIGQELLRNLVLAMIAVFAVTLILISNIWASCLVWLCVIFTLIDVAGTLQLWGLSIETAFAINLILAVGLAVDYAAHIAHTFMITPGTREERVAVTIEKMAPAVFNGGFSTFLAFVILSRSQSHAFLIFFKVYFTVVLFGLFHGLVFLPVVLSWIGPPPYESVTESANAAAAATAATTAADDGQNDVPLNLLNNGKPRRGADNLSSDAGEMDHLTTQTSEEQNEVV